VTAVFEQSWGAPPLGGRTPLVGGREGLAAVVVAEAIARSMEAGEEVVLEA
jgi:hypothetical protein